MSLSDLSLRVYKKYLRGPGFRAVALAAMLLGLVAVMAHAAAPAWWSERGVIDPAVTPDNNAIANVGQLKHLATKAAEEMNEKLAGWGGAGTAIDTLVASWDTSPPFPDNYNALNQGQLKTVAKVFYERLAELDYEGPPLLETTGIFPWTASTGDDDSYALVNLGQLKQVFSFDPTYVRALPTDGLRLWLRADQGLPSSGPVAEWEDQSGLGHHAVQSDSGRRPEVVASAMNGQAVVRFDGANDFFSLPDLLSGATAGEIYIVTRLDNFNNTYNGLCQFGTTSGVAYSSDLVWDDFGLVDWDAYLGPGSGVVTQTHIYNSSVTAEGLSSIRFNGNVLRNRGPGEVAFTSTPLLGNDVYNEYYPGDIAEVLVYDRALSAAERAAVHAYLAVKYAPPGITLPDAPVLAAHPGSSDSVDLSWSTTTDTGQRLVAILERQTGAGEFRVVATLDSSLLTPEETVLAYTDAGLVPGQTYAYRVRLRTYVGVSAYSDPVVVTLPVDIPSLPTSGLLLWLRADTGAGASVSAWLDQSGLGNDATQDSDPDQRPALVPDVLNGLPVVRFDGIDDILWLPYGFMDDRPAAEIFAVLRVNHRPDHWNTQWGLGLGGTGYYNDNNYDGFGLDFQPDGPGASLATRTQFHLDNTSVDATAWTKRINGTVVRTLSGGTVAWRSDPNLGQNGLDGDFAEIILYDRVLTETEREAVVQYFTAKYDLDLVPDADTAPPSVPAGLAATGVSDRQFTLSWEASTDDIAVADYDISRDGVLLDSLSPAAGLSLTVTGLAPSTTYEFRVRARDASGNLSDWSDPLPVATEALPSGPPGILFWLNADSGPAPDTEGRLALWPDSGPLGNDAAQDGEIGRRPTLVPDVLNGLPVVRFDGADDIMWLPYGLLDGRPSAEIIAVLRVNDRPDHWNTQWGFGLGATGYYNDDNYDGFGLGSQPGGSGALLATRTQFHIDNTSVDASAWVKRINGIPVRTRTGDTVVWRSDPNLGQAEFDGDFAEIIVYDRVLTETEREAAVQYLAGKYGLPGVAGTDITAPDAPSGLRAGEQDETSLTLFWDVPHDDTGATGYDVYLDGVWFGSASTPSLRITGLAPSVPREFHVRARDAVGNLSALSAPLSASASADPAPAFLDTDGDGVYDVYEIARGTDAEDYYDGHTPQVTLVSGGDPDGAPLGETLPTTVVFLVLDSQGRPLANAPVSLSALGLLAPLGSSASPSSTITLRTDANGYVSVNWTLPGTIGDPADLAITITGGGTTLNTRSVYPLWQPGRPYVAVRLLPPGTPNLANIKPVKVTESGWVLLRLFPGNSLTLGYRWFEGTPEPIQINLSGQGPYGGYVFDINNSGKVAGFYHIRISDTEGHAKGFASTPGQSEWQQFEGLTLPWRSLLPFVVLDSGVIYGEVFLSGGGSDAL